MTTFSWMEGNWTQRITVAHSRWRMARSQESGWEQGSSCEIGWLLSNRLLSEMNILWILVLFVDYDYIFKILENKVYVYGFLRINYLVTVRIQRVWELFSFKDYGNGSALPMQLELISNVASYFIELLLFQCFSHSSLWSPFLSLWSPPGYGILFQSCLSLLPYWWVLFPFNLECWLSSLGF